MLTRVSASLLIVLSIALVHPAVPCGQSAAQMQRARVHFQQPVVVNGKVLVGDFFLVHDETRADRGEPCTTMYRLASGERIVAFHCVRRQRAPTATFTLVTRPLMVGGLKAAGLVEYQFAGDSDAHGVPGM